MIGVVVALAAQMVWYALVAVIKYADLDPDLHRVQLTFAVLVATNLAIAVSMARLARRLTGTRKAGAVLVTLAHVAITTSLAVQLCVLYKAFDGATAAAWFDGMFRGGWSALEIASVVGFALAAGRRGAWLAPVSVGVALLKRLTNPEAAHIDLLPFMAVSAALVVWMAFEAERHAAPVEPAPDRARCGMQWCEQLAWLSAVMSAVGVVTAAAGVSSIYLSLPFATIGAIANVAFAIAAWAIADARVSDLPGWPWFATAMAALWAAARTTRVWFLTLVRHWGHLDEVKLVRTHWSVHIPAVLAVAAAFIGLALFARRRRSRELLISSIATLVFVVAIFAVRVAVASEVVFASGCYVIANVAAARIYRASRRELDGALPRARVV